MRLSPLALNGVSSPSARLYNLLSKVLDPNRPIREAVGFLFLGTSSFVLTAIFVDLLFALMEPLHYRRSPWYQHGLVSEALPKVSVTSRTDSSASFRWYSASSPCMAASCSSVMDRTLAVDVEIIWHHGRAFLPKSRVSRRQPPVNSRDDGGRTFPEELQATCRGIARSPRCLAAMSVEGARI